MRPGEDHPRHYEKAQWHRLPARYQSSSAELPTAVDDGPIDQAYHPGPERHFYPASHRGEWPSGAGVRPKSRCVATRSTVSMFRSY